MAYRSIVPANISKIRIGARIGFNYGWGLAELGNVTAHRIDGNASLVVELETGEIEHVHSITNIGIGAHLIELADRLAFLGEA